MIEASRAGSRYGVYATEYDVETDAGTLIEEGSPPRDALAMIREAMAEARDPVPASDHDVRDTLVTFVVALCGSARATIHRQMAAVIRQAEAIEAAGGKVAILGYTTTSWIGGNSRKQWLSSGDANVPGRGPPGRLCDLLHVVLKDVDAPMVDVVEEVAVGADHRILRENVDGEGLEWAYERALDSGIERISLVHVKDKTVSVDDSTNFANGSHGDLLRDHAAAVVDRIVLEGRASLSLAVMESWKYATKETSLAQAVRYPVVEYAEPDATMDVLQAVLASAVDRALAAVPAPRPSPAGAPAGP